METPHTPDWNGSLCPYDPDNYWIDDDTGERVNAQTGERMSAKSIARACNCHADLLAALKDCREVLHAILTINRGGTPLEVATISAAEAAINKADPLYFNPKIPRAAILKAEQGGQL